MRLSGGPKGPPLLLRRRMVQAERLPCQRTDDGRGFRIRFSNSSDAFAISNGLMAYFVISPVNGSFATVAPQEACFSGT